MAEYGGTEGMGSALNEFMGHLGSGVTNAQASKKAS